MSNEINEKFATDKSDLTAIDYESVDLLNRLPFSQSSLVDYIADFDDSVEIGKQFSWIFNDQENKDEKFAVTSSKAKFHDVLWAWWLENCGDFD